MQAIPGAIPVTVSATPLAIWCSDFRGSSDDALATPVFSPVRGAYVACIRMSGGHRGTLAEALRLRVGRTNEFGWVMHRERAELGGEKDVLRSGWRPMNRPVAGAPDDVDTEDAGVPRPTSLEMFLEDDPVFAEYDTSAANADAMYVLPNETYRIHWSYDQTLFDLFLAQYEDDPERAFAEFRVREYVVEPFDTTSERPFLSELTPVERGWVTRQLSVGREGYHAGWPRTDGMSCAIFDGTPHSLRTLFFCEWLHHTCVGTTQRDDDWGYLHALRGVIEASRSGAVIPDLAAKMPTDERAGAAYQMRAYLHALASAGFKSRGVVKDLVNVARLGQLGDWKSVALQLRKHAQFNAVTHPALTRQGEVSADVRKYWFSSEEQAALVGYFDMYVLGFDFTAEKEHIEAEWARVVECAGWVLSNANKRLASVSHEELMRAVSVHVPKSSARQQMPERYFRSCAQLGVRFWEHASVAVVDQAQWNAYKPFLVWLAEDAGLLGEVLVDALKPHLRAYRNCTALELETLVDYFFRHHLTLSDQPVHRRLPELKATLTLEKLGEGGEVIATITTRKQRTELARLQLFSTVATADADRALAPVGRPVSKQSISRYKAAQGKALRTFSAREATVRMPDADALEAFPKQLALFASAVKTSIALKEVISAVQAQRLSDVDPMLFVNLAQETLAAVGPTTEWIAWARDGRSYQGANEWLVRGGQRFVRAGLSLEAIRGVLAGATTLATLLPDSLREGLHASGTTDRDRYLRDKQSFAALVETTKGLVQVAVGAAQLCVLAGTTTLAGVAVSQVVSIGLTAVAFMDIVIYLDTGGASPVQEFKDRVIDAKLRQFAAAPSSNAADSKPKQPACLRARRLAQLNMLAKAG